MLIRLPYFSKINLVIFIHRLCNFQVSKRLQQELMSLMMSNDKGISAFPDGDKLFEWIATVNGPADSVYDGLKYKLRLEFPAAYPYTAPTVKFVTPCFHPNVDQHGNICLDILKEKWSALYEVRTILLSIQSLLGMNKVLISNAEIFIYRAWNIVTPLIYPKVEAMSGNALGIWICGCRCILESSGSQNSGCT